MRPEAPLLIVTADFGHAKRFATRTISSAFALPSTGGDFTRAVQRPALDSSSTLTREFGFTFTCKTLTVRRAGFNGANPCLRIIPRHRDLAHDGFGRVMAFQVRRIAAFEISPEFAAVRDDGGAERAAC